VAGVEDYRILLCPERSPGRLTVYLRPWISLEIFGARGWSERRPELALLGGRRHLKMSSAGGSSGKEFDREFTNGPPWGARSL